MFVTGNPTAGGHGISIVAEGCIRTDGAEVLLIDRGEWRGADDALVRMAFREVSTSPGLASRSNIGRACFSPSPGLVEPEVPFRNKAVLIPKTYEPKMAAGNGHMGDFAGLEVR
jgi:hypothetical protein